ncbi:MAG: RHS repeat-associated core domain-containing protein [Chthonomonadales bacterium]
MTTTFDARGMMAVVQDSSGILTRSYDAMGRVSVWNAPGHQNGQPLTNSYDAVGNRTKLDTWWGPVSWTFDARNAIATVADPGFVPTSIPGGITTWTHDPRGMISRQDNCDATYSTLSYDPNGQTLQMEHLTNASALIDRAWYTYDAAGRPLTKLTGDGTSSYGYDHADRLTSENHPIAGLLTWTYDPAGRRIMAQDSNGISTLSYDIADGLISVTKPAGVTSYSQDSNGNNTKVQPPTGSPTSYTWDPANRLTQAKLPNGDTHTNTFRSDNMRTKHVSPIGIENFLWDSDALPGLLGVIGKDAAASHLAIHGPNMSRMVGRYSEGAGGMVAQFHLDRQDSVLAITRLASGSPVTDIRYKMDAFGVVYSGAIAGNPYVYVGGHGYLSDLDLSFLQVRNRELEPELGRWLSRDPIGFAGGDWNLWGYVGNAPTTMIDPTATNDYSALALRCPLHDPPPDGDYAIACSKTYATSISATFQLPKCCEINQPGTFINFYLSMGGFEGGVSYSKIHNGWRAFFNILDLEDLPVLDYIKPYSTVTMKLQRFDDGTVKFTANGVTKYSKKYKLGSLDQIRIVNATAKSSPSNKHSEALWTSIVVTGGMNPKAFQRGNEKIVSNSFSSVLLDAKLPCDASQFKQ